MFNKIEYNRTYYLKNREKILTQVKEYYKKNKPRIAKYRLDYETQRRLKDPSYRIGRNLKRRVSQELKRFVSKEKTHRIKYIGCSLDSLKEHIEKQFECEMNWKNYGDWHIDHIRPLSSFDLGNEEERFKAFNYKNLQPLWAEENLRKGKKYVK